MKVHKIISVKLSVAVSSVDMFSECQLMTSVIATSECLLPTLGELHISFLLLQRYRLFSVQEFVHSVKFMKSSY